MTTTCIRWGDRWIGLPSKEVRCLLDWEVPRVLPGGAPWLQGWLVHEGSILPVLDPRSLTGGETGVKPSLLVVAALEESLLGIPGEEVEILRGMDPEASHKVEKPWTGESVTASGARILLTDADQLYTILSVHYTYISRTGG